MISCSAYLEAPSCSMQILALTGLFWVHRVIAIFDSKSEDLPKCFWLDRFDAFIISFYSHQQRGVSVARQKAFVYEKIC